MGLSYDANGNLTADGLFQYQYDAWNRLTGVWYADGDMSQAAERVARYRYDGLSRRVWKQITNQGEGVVHRSDDGGVTGIQAGDRYEHYFYSGWRLVETTNHVNGLISGVYDYAVSYVLNQFVYGTQYIDEPVRYDRNLQPSAQNRTCIGTGGDDLDASYFYHQDANYRVVMLTDEDGYVVERTTYAAYGEPTVHGGHDSGVAAELGNPLLVSTVGNPFMHQGLFRDRETRTYQIRFRHYDSRSGRLLQRDPLGYQDGMSLYEYVQSGTIDFVDPLGLQAASTATTCPTTKPSGLYFFTCDDGKRKDLTRSEVDALVNPQNDPYIARKLDLGCNGLCALYQGKNANYPEDAPGTKCFRSEEQAKRCKCDDGSDPFVFAKQGNWKDDKPPKTGPDGSVPGDSIRRRVPGGDPVLFNYITVFTKDGKTCYVWMNFGISWAKPDKPQKLTVCPWPTDDRDYPQTIWCRTCK